MSSLFYRDLKTAPMIAEYSANEVIASNKHRLVSSRGDRYHGYYDDLSAGAGITCLGHSNERIKEAMIDQIDNMPYIHAMNWSHAPAEQLAAKLIDLTVRGNPASKFSGGKVMFLNTGAEAVEAACKVAMQVGYEQHKSPWFYGRQYSYHGNTLFTLALGHHPKKLLYPFMGMIDVDRFDAYQPSVDKGYATVLLEGLSYELNLASERMQSIVVIEPIGGTTIGIEPSSKTYLDMLASICTESKAILIYDEVLCGNYRTGELFAYQHYNAQEPDIICLGKGLTGGYFPLSAIIVSRPLVETIMAGSGKLWHSTTNQNHPIGCAAGIAALEEYEKIKEKLPEFGKSVFDFAVEQLSKCSCELYGTGSLWGLRLDPNVDGLHMAVRREALKHQIVVYTDGQTIEGKGNMVLLAPPYCYLEYMGNLEDALHSLALAVQDAMSMVEHV